MKVSKKISIVALIVVFSFGFIEPSIAFAATTPSLGTAGTFGILSSTFTRNTGVTAITGDLGYTTLSGSGSHTLTGTDYASTTSTYTNAGTAQGTALTNLNNQACTYTFPTGAIDLATDTTHGSIGVYVPGVYCTGASSAASIGTAGITLRGAGTYIFRINGALTSVANSSVTLSNSAASCDVFWTPTAATTLGANSTFKGVVIDNSGITVNSTVAWIGRALAFGGTVTTDTDTITSTCTTSFAGAGGQKYGNINVIKTVINDNGGTKTVADFPLFVNGNLVVSGVTNAFPAPGPVYTITETSNSNYTQTFSGACDSDGRLNLNPNDLKVCVITNNDKGVPVAVVPPLIDIVKVPSPLALPNGPGPVTYTYTLRNTGTVPVTDITLTGDSCSPIVLASGDTNADNKLQVNETWVYRCTTQLTATHTNIVTSTGWANGISASDVASATVVVGSAAVPPLIHVTKVPSTFILPAVGGAVTYTEKVSNPGVVALSNIILSDDKCAPVTYVSGDTNNDKKLDTSETWTYTCQSTLTRSTTNIATVTGWANGISITDFAIATVLVASPGLPNTGFPLEAGAVSLDVIMFALILVVVAVSLIVILRRRKG